MPLHSLCFYTFAFKKKCMPAYLVARKSCRPKLHNAKKDSKNASQSEM